MASTTQGAVAQQLQVQCARAVELHDTRDESTAKALRTTSLQPLLQLKKEIGNARLVSGDTMLWVGGAKLTQRDIATGDASAKEIRIEQGKRAFVFTLETTAASKHFVDSLKQQVDGTAGLEVRRKKRKLRKQLAHATTGFVPVNTLASPATQTPSKPPGATPTKPPATPTKTPTSGTKPLRLAKPLDISVTPAATAEPYALYTSPSPSKSPFRSPFRKKPAATPRPIAAPLSPLLSDPRIKASPRVREWLSPVAAHKRKSNERSPDLRRESFGTPSSSSSAGRQSAEPSPSPRLANRRVRSLQGLLDDVPRDTQPLASSPPPTARSLVSPPPPTRPQLTPPQHPRPQLTPPPRPPQPEQSPPLSSVLQLTPAKRSAADMAARKPHIVSHYFANKARKTDAATSPRSSELSPRAAAAGTEASRHIASPSEAATSRESTQEIDDHASDNTLSLTAPAQRHMRGLLNLGNYCYMNAIVQAVTKLPGFATGVQDLEWLYTVIRKQLGAEAASANSMTLERVRALVATWRANDVDKTLALHTALDDVLQQIVRGSDVPINPETLKHVMGRKNAIFATHFQQDAHEFLLNLVNEYEMELLQAAKSALATVKQETVEEEAAPATAAAPKKSSLLNFFRSEPKADDAHSDSVEAAASTTPSVPLPPPPQVAADDDDELVSELLPAKCFRAELYRTLTCSVCGYSRKQVERFYDFSLDLPLHDASVTAAAASVAAHVKPSKRQCYCDADAAVRNTITERIYHCASAACSFQEKVSSEIAPEPVPASELSQPQSESDMDVDGVAAAAAETTAPPRSTILLDSLMRKQFESETLELSCEKCTSGKQAVAAYAVKALPPVLVLHLKRFEVDFQTGKLYKRCDFVEAPARIHPRHAIVGDVFEGDEQPYELVSVVHHLGRSIDEGHYVADVREREGEWVRRNDTHESAISEDYALRASRSQESCYMFFYVRKDTLTENLDKENVLASGVATIAAAKDVATHESM